MSMTINFNGFDRLFVVTKDYDVQNSETHGGDTVGNVVSSLKANDNGDMFLITDIERFHPAPKVSSQVIEAIANCICNNELNISEEYHDMLEYFILQNKGD